MQQLQKLVEDGKAGKDNFSLAKLQAKFFINAPSKVQCAVLETINNGELPSEGDVDKWCASAVVHKVLNELVENETLADSEVKDQISEKVCSNFFFLFYLFNALRSLFQ